MIVREQTVYCGILDCDELHIHACDFTLNKLIRCPKTLIINHDINAGTTQKAEINLFTALRTLHLRQHVVAFGGLVVIVLAIEPQSPWIQIRPRTMDF
jgi:hypothetical protein